MLEFFAALFLMLAGARLLGEGARRVNQPALVGELIAGTILGVSALNLVTATPDLAAVTNVSLFLIMFLTGLNLSTEDLADVGWKAAVMAIPAFTIPFALGVVGASALGVGLQQSLGLGLALSITAVPVNSMIMMDLGILKTKLGNSVITVGVIEDQMALIILGVILQLPAGGSAASIDYGSVALSLVKVGIFVGAVLYADRWMREHPGRVEAFAMKLGPRLLARESGLAFILVFGIGVSLLAEAMGLHFIIGTYFAGLLVSQAFSQKWLARGLDIISAMTFGLFAPLLFAYIGIQLNLYSVAGVAVLFVVVLVLAVGGKMFGGYVGARLGGFSPGDSKVIGALLNSRGMVELVIASIMYTEGVIDLTLFSVVVSVGIITTVMSATMAKAALGGRVPE